MAIGDFFTGLGQRVGKGLTAVGGYDPMQQVSPEEAARRRQEGLSALQRSLGRSAAILSGDPRRMELAEQQMQQAERDKLLQQLARDPRYAEQIKLLRAGLDPRSFAGQKLTADQENYNLAVKQGYEGTFMDYMKEKKAPLVTIDQKQETEFQKEATKSAFRTLEKAQQEVNQFVDIEGRLNILQKQLEGGELETGIFEEMKIPFQRLAAGLNILPEDELKKLGSKELLQEL